MKILAFDTSTSYAAIALWHNQQCLVDTRYHLGNQHSEFLLTEIEHHLQRLGWQRSAIDAIVVGLGPGSFTGLRVGIATAQGLSFALSRPLYGVSSLDALAQSAPYGPSLLALCTDARKQELYVRWYRRQTLSPSAPSSDSPNPEQQGHHSQPHKQHHNLPVVGMDRTDWSAPTVLPVSSHLLLTPASLAQHLGSLQEEVLLMGQGASLYAEALQAQVPQRLFWASPLFDSLWASHLIALALPQIQAGEVHPPQHIQPIYIRPSEAEMNIGPPTGGSPLKHRIQEDGTILPDPAEESASTTR